MKTRVYKGSKWRSWLFEAAYYWSNLLESLYQTCGQILTFSKALFSYYSFGFFSFLEKSN